MPLFPGTHLGPYEITGPLGSGGMGEVYRATDTRLDRTVAIKILPRELSNDPLRKQRFERGDGELGGSAEYYFHRIMPASYRNSRLVRQGEDALESKEMTRANVLPTIRHLVFSNRPRQTLAHRQL